MSIHITSNTRSLCIRPTSKAELRSLIKQELERQGPDADLNFIDVSQITNMARLFGGLKIGNIKIEWWDVSNVTDMSNMFCFCYDFNCDLSHWDVSNVKNMDFMFAHCYTLKCNLSKWRPDVDELFDTFNECKLMTADLLPYF